MAVCGVEYGRYILPSVGKGISGAGLQVLFSLSYIVKKDLKSQFTSGNLKKKWKKKMKMPQKLVWKPKPTLRQILLLLIILLNLPNQVRISRVFSLRFLQPQYQN